MDLEFLLKDNFLKGYLILMTCHNRLLHSLWAEKSRSDLASLAPSTAALQEAYSKDKFSDVLEKENLQGIATFQLYCLRLVLAIVFSAHQPQMAPTAPQALETWHKKIMILNFCKRAHQVATLWVFSGSLSNLLEIGDHSLLKEDSSVYYLLMASVALTAFILMNDGLDLVKLVQDAFKPQIPVRAVADRPRDPEVLPAP